MMRTIGLAASVLVLVPAGCGDRPCACYDEKKEARDGSCEEGLAISASAICTGQQMPMTGATTCEPPLGWAYTTAEIDQALTALRDRATASIFVIRSFDGNFSGVYVNAYSPGDGTVYFETLSFADTYLVTFPKAQFQLKEPAFFDGCLAMADVGARVDCLFAMTGDPVETCGG